MKQVRRIQKTAQRKNYIVTVMSGLRWKVTAIMQFPLNKYTIDTGPSVS